MTHAKLEENTFYIIGLLFGKKGISKQFLEWFCYLLNILSGA